MSQRTVFPLPDLPLHALASGTGRDLLLVHGAVCDASAFAPVQDALGTTHRAIAPSLRHHSPMEWDGDSAYSLATHVDDLDAAYPRGSKQIDLLGHSRGGAVALLLALRRPDLVRRLILVEPFVMLEKSLLVAPMPRTEIAAAIKDGAALVRAGDEEAGLARFLDVVDREGAWAKGPEDTRAMLRRNVQTLPALLASRDVPVTRDDLSGYAIPTLLIEGADSPAIFPAMQDALEIVLPGARRVRIPGASHFVFRDAPAAFVAAVSAFMAG